MVLESIFGGFAGFGVTCGSTVDIPQGGKCKVTFKIKNTGTLTASGDYIVTIYDSNNNIVGDAVGTYTVEPGTETSITTQTITIEESAAIGSAKVYVAIYKGTASEENLLDIESCSIVNIVSGIAAEITSISIVKV